MHFPRGFDPSSSVLFLGAGFSRSAKSVIGKAPPLGRELEIEIKKACDIPEDDVSSLQDISKYAFDQGVDLHGILSNLYTIKSLEKNQPQILSMPWLRVYTTNYDDIVELFWREKGGKGTGNSYTIGDSVPTQLRPGSVIHLHGYIHKCTKENVLSQLVLSHHSYAQQRAISSPWWEIFERDIRVAQNVFFLGYELNDFEPAAYLTKNPSVAGKTHFILRPAKSPVIASRLQDYGTRHSIAIEGFAEECKAAVVGQKPEHANALKGFRYFDLLKDDKLAPQPSPIEIQSLFSFGSFKINRLISTFPKASYIIPRQRKIEECIEKLQESQTLILHSKIGNGKTIFRQGLCVALTLRGHSCFEVRENTTPPATELDFLRQRSKVVVFFPDYDTAYATIHLFADMKPDARFVVEIGTSTLQVRHGEVLGRLKKKIERVDLNYLDEGDCRDVYDLLKNAGIAPRDFGKKFKRGAEFRDIIISIFENEKIAERIDRIVGGLVEDADTKLVLFCSAILKAIGLRTDPGFLRAISQVDAYQALTQAGEGVYEFVDFSHDRIEPHSALFSEFLIKRYLKPHEFAGAVFRMASEAARRMHEEDSYQSERAREARSTLSSLLRFSFLNDILRAVPDKDQHIRLVYEHSRRDTYIQGEPLFWLQYSIFMQESGHWELAERHMDTAYQRGADRPGFRTYQLDTNSLGLAIDLEEQRAEDAPVERAARIIELLERVREIMAEGNHRGHVLKVLGRFENFLRRRNPGLHNGERVALVYQLNLIIAYLDELPLEDKTFFGSDAVKLSLKRAVATIVASPAH